MSSVSAVLLRILLSLALILNGVGSAAASVQMAEGMMSPEPHGMQTVASESGDSSCPEHHAAAAASGTDQVALHPSPSKNGHHPSPDCCKSFTCGCVCVHACASVPVAVIQAPVIPSHDLGVIPMVDGRPSPTLPHLIRPPIG
jgi:hypothetical protein